jgi:sialate O-acetylesterase
VLQAVDGGGPHAARGRAADDDHGVDLRSFGGNCRQGRGGERKGRREGAALRVTFAHAGDGLVAHDRPVQSLEVAGADRVFRPATAQIIRDTLLVSAPDVRDPVAVRYAWSNAPEANLYNGSGLPAAPFRSDNW